MPCRYGLSRAEKVGRRACCTNQSLRRYRESHSGSENHAYAPRELYFRHFIGGLRLAGRAGETAISSDLSDARGWGACRGKSAGAGSVVANSTCRPK